jgi:hypothetical protein
MKESVNAVASFVTNPFPNFADSYTGRLAPATGLTLANTGMLSLKVTKLGQITGKLSLGGKSYVVKGQFRPDGSAPVIVIKRTGLADAILALTLDLTIGGSERITGQLAADGAVLPVSIDRAVYDGKNNPSPQSSTDPKGKPIAAIYTVVLPRDPGQLATPQGHGFGVATVKADGSVRWVGVLGDGTTLSQSGVISKTGEWPFHALPYKGRGVLTGALHFRAVAGASDLDGTLAWIKPAIAGSTITYPEGFTRQIPLIGARYDRTVAVSGGTLTYGEGNLGIIPAPVPFSGLAGKFSAAPVVSGFSFQVAPASGLFKGTLLTAAGPRSIKFQGIIFQKTERGYGLFIGAPSPAGAGLSTGFVEVTSP